MLTGHKSYINDCMFDPENTYLVSTGDDNTVKIWTTSDYELKSTFLLTSSGINTSVHLSIS